jgi:hypothetical protein
MMYRSVGERFQAQRTVMPKNGKRYERLSQYKWDNLAPVQQAQPGGCGNTITSALTWAFQA